MRGIVARIEAALQGTEVGPAGSVDDGDLAIEQGTIEVENSFTCWSALSKTA